jgi:hypothetical protein
VMQKVFRRGHALSQLAVCAMLAACGGGGGDSGATNGGLLQAIEFDYPGGAMLLDGPVTLHAVASSGLPVSFESSTPDTCTVAGDQLTLVSAGECRVVATQPGGQTADGVTWAAADEATQLFNVLKHTQQITFVPPDYVLSAQTSSIELSATAESGLPVSFSTSTPEVCTITGSTLQLKGKGSCAVVAAQEGDPNYAAGATPRFIAVDPLLLADGFTPGSGAGSGNLATKQGGAVVANPWASPLNGWEWCNAQDDSGNSNENWCYRTVSDDGTTLTSALHVPDSRLSGWYTGFNRINIFAPGLAGFNGSGDTTSGLRVTSEKVLAFTLGVNKTLAEYPSPGRPVVVNLDLGKSNGGCNVELSALVWPDSGLVSYGIPLGDFAVTNNCGLADVTATSLDSVRALPDRNGPVGATPDEVARAEADYQTALAGLKDARAAAAGLLGTSDVVRVRFWMYDFNDKVKPAATDVPPPTAEELARFDTDLTIKGAITIQ